MMYALFKDGKIITPKYNTAIKCWKIAIENNLIIVVLNNFGGKDKLLLQQGYEIREIKEQEDERA